MKYKINLVKTDKELRDCFFKLSTQSDVAKLLEISEKNLTYWLYVKSDNEKYITFEIQKKSKGIRIINAPIASLKIIQSKLNYILNLIYKPKIATHGFVKKQTKDDEKGNKIDDIRTIISNAKLHTNKKYVLNIDLQDFFPSINFGRIYGAFQSEPYNLNKDVAKVLAKICCIENSDNTGELPQGSPSSPVVSNIICRNLDNQLIKLAISHKCTYSRYADDITFSTNLSYFPSTLAKYKPDNEILKYTAGKDLEKIIIDNGFKINPNKVRIQTKMERQEVTGIIVNKKTNVNRTYIKQIRAMLHAWEKYTEEKAEEHFHEKYYSKQGRIPNNKVKFRDVLRGKINFIKQVRGEEDDIYRKLYNKYCILAGDKKELYPLLRVVTEQSRLLDFINTGEGQFLEFKQTYSFHGDYYCGALRYCSQKDQKTGETPKFKVFRAINAFLNSQNGGHVFLGVTDAHVIVGLEKEFNKFKNKDKFELDIRNGIKEHFNPIPYEKVFIKFDEIKKITICHIEVKPCNEIIYFDDNRVFIRDGNTSIEAKGNDLVQWCRENDKISLQCSINRNL